MLYTDDSVGVCVRRATNEDEELEMNRNPLHWAARASLMILAAGAAVSLVGATGVSGEAAASDEAPADAFAHLPAKITLDGTARDFRAGHQTNPHPDFQSQPRNSSGNGAFGHYAGIVASRLGADGKPVYASGGYRVLSNAHDAAGREMLPMAGEVASRSGDVAAEMDNEGSAVTSAESLSQWFRDVPGVNASKAVSIELVREPGSDQYVFDDQLDERYRALGGFFPLNGELYGNYENGKNYHFTYEIATSFQYREGSGQVFRFTGDDDVWVYVDGHLVIDLGGVHGALDQTIDLDRLEWLNDGEVYSLNFFFAERHTTKSNFRIETTLQLKSLDMPLMAPLWD